MSRGAQAYRRAFAGQREVLAVGADADLRELCKAWYLCGQQSCWTMYMWPFRFTAIHRAGWNAIVLLLSRTPIVNHT